MPVKRQIALDDIALKDAVAPVAGGIARQPRACE